jgi:hypothetical protein
MISPATLAVIGKKPVALNNSVFDGTVPETCEPDTHDIIRSTAR